MRTQQHAVPGENDLHSVKVLPWEYREKPLPAADLPYQRGTWALDDPANGHRWSGETGCLLVWAMFQFPFHPLDLVCRSAMETQLLPGILAWADERSREHPEIIALGKQRPADLPGEAYRTPEGCRPTTGWWSHLHSQRGVH